MMKNEIMLEGLKAIESGKKILEEIKNNKDVFYSCNVDDMAKIEESVSKYTTYISERFDRRIKRLIYEDCQIETFKSVDYIIITIELNHSRFRLCYYDDKKEIGIEPMSLATIKKDSNNGADYKMLKLMAHLLENEDLIVDYCERMFDEAFDIDENLKETIGAIRFYRSMTKNGKKEKEE